jgi:hypothetical protein
MIGWQVHADSAARGERPHRRARKNGYADFAATRDTTRHSAFTADCESFLVN